MTKLVSYKCSQCGFINDRIWCTKCGSLAEYVSPYEAKCPHCGSTIRGMDACRKCGRRDVGGEFIPM